VQKMLLRLLAFLGRLLGYEASYPEYGDDRKDTGMKQKQVLLTKKGGPEVLEVVEREAPEPGPGEARVKVLATGVAFADVMMRRGLYPGVPNFPFTPGYDLVGEVEDLGPNVSGVAVGQRVAALTQIGAYAQYVSLPAGELVRVPAGIDAVEAASLPVNYVTAHQMLFRVAKVKPGERILVHGAAGGVGTAMLQLGRLQGLEMYGTASAGKHDLVSGLGATPIDYKAEDFVERVRALTGDGVDAVFDPIGGAHVARSFGTLRRGGRLVVYGLSSSLASGGSFVGLAATTLGRIRLWNTLPNGKRATFYTINTFKKKHPEWFREDLALLLGLLAEGRIQPIVAERLPLEEVVRAHELMESAGARGKLVLLPNG
jgi:NADPH:quinone reductase-like Zn-dependent oxidoreductase